MNKLLRKFKLFLVVLLIKPVTLMVKLVTRFVMLVIKLQGPKPGKTDKELTSEVLQIFAQNPKLFPANAKRPAAWVTNHTEKVDAATEAFFNNPMIQSMLGKIKDASESMQTTGRCGMIKRINKDFTTVSPIQIPSPHNYKTVKAISVPEPHMGYTTDERLQDAIRKLEDYSKAVDAEHPSSFCCDKDFSETEVLMEVEDSDITEVGAGALESLRKATFAIEDEMDVAPRKLITFGKPLPKKKRSVKKPVKKAAKKKTVKKPLPKKPSKKNKR